MAPPAYRVISAGGGLGRRVLQVPIEPLVAGDAVHLGMLARLVEVLDLAMAGEAGGQVHRLRGRRLARRGLGGDGQVRQQVEAKDQGGTQGERPKELLPGHRRPPWQTEQSRTRNAPARPLRAALEASWQTVRSRPRGPPWAYFVDPESEYHAGRTLVKVPPRHANPRRPCHLPRGPASTARAGPGDGFRSRRPLRPGRLRKQYQAPEPPSAGRTRP